MSSSMGLRNSRNVQSSVASTVYVGLRAEHLHAIDLHATNLHSDEGLDVFSELKNLRIELNELREKLSNLCLNDLADIDVSDATEGDVLVCSDKLWRATELRSGEDEETTHDK